MAQEAIWPGSGSAASGSTPFGLFDTDSEFQTEAPQVATWCARRLGYPIVDIELQDTQFYCLFGRIYIRIFSTSKSIQYS